jgi:hypothetical protein
MTIENSNERGQHGGKIAANTAKDGGSCRTAKGARNLLVHFGHPKISFGQIVAKRKSQIVEEGQDTSSKEAGIHKEYLLLCFSNNFLYQGHRAY